MNGRVAWRPAQVRNGQPALPAGATTKGWQSEASPCQYEEADNSREGDQGQEPVLDIFLPCDCLLAGVLAEKQG